MKKNLKQIISNKKASRAGGYRKQLITSDFLEPYINSVERFINNLIELQTENKISSAELVAISLITLLTCRRSDAFQKSNSEMVQTISTEKTSYSITDFKELLLHSDLPIQKLLSLFNGTNHLSLTSFIKNYRFRGVPASAQLALIHWLEGRYPLTLFFYIPSAKNVFEMQKQGQRCITIFRKADSILRPHRDRDIISFIIHDLMHAHEFYSIPKKAHHQIGFYQWLDKIIQTAEIKELLTQSEDFKNQLDYVMSDMNSYCGHLIKTLQAIIVIHSPVDKKEKNWCKICEQTLPNLTDQNLVKKINSSEWGISDFLAVEKLMEKFYQKANSTF